MKRLSISNINKTLCRVLSVLTVLLIVSGCLSSCGTAKSVKRGKRPHTTVVTPHHGSDVKAHGLRKAIIEESLSWEGTPYKYADAEKGRGTDCSGMVLRVYEKVAGIKLPRNSAAQSEYCSRLKDRNVRPGDLAFFATGSDPDRVSHVGIMIDGTRFIHASTKKGVVISDITTPYYQRTFICFGRVPDRRLED